MKSNVFSQISLYESLKNWNKINIMIDCGLFGTKSIETIVSNNLISFKRQYCVFLFTAENLFYIVFNLYNYLNYDK